jgi:exosortase
MNEPPLTKNPHVYSPFSPGRSGPWLPAILLLICWFCVIRILWTDWKIDPQYGYGILVPVMVVGLLLGRKEDAPRPSACVGTDRFAGFLLLLCSGAALSFLVPMCTANPDWRPLGWLAALSGIGLTLGVLLLAGGRPWLRHFAFPVFFFLIAVPWPRNAESAVMSFLMGWNTSVTLEILHWLGYEATGRGNLIQLPCGILGIEEACSGIRSLQSGLMVALFAGEFFRLGMIRRIALLLLALLAALTGNILRNAFLAVIASRHGLSAVTSWHDTAGYFILALTVGAVVLTAALWARTSPRVPVSAKPSPFDPLDRSPRDRPAEVPPFRPKSLAWIPFWVALLMLTASLLGTEAWFRAHERGGGGGLTWDLHSRNGAPGVSPVAVAPQTLTMLLHPEGFSEKWVLPTGEIGQVFYFRWPPGRSSVQAMTMHNPEVCLGSIGMKLNARLGRFDCDGIPFESLLFSQAGKTVHVFHSRIREGSLPGEPVENFLDTPGERLGNLLAGRRNRGERMIEVALWNLPDEHAARRALASYLAEALVRTPGDLKPSDR